jgi:hypothetical protein
LGEKLNKTLFTNKCIPLFDKGSIKGVIQQISVTPSQSIFATFCSENQVRVWKFDKQQGFF